ncbi:hypothetical protein C8Q75DRAFT_803751 [Abortiporus biennis]|nr:hypothetical protein C8Q75DRAFT_803751 [Abortiporus biennis]
MKKGLVLPATETAPTLDEEDRLSVIAQSKMHFESANIRRFHNRFRSRYDLLAVPTTIIVRNTLRLFPSSKDRLLGTESPKRYIGIIFDKQSRDHLHDSLLAVSTTTITAGSRTPFEGKR